MKKTIKPPRLSQGSDQQSTNSDENSQSNTQKVEDKKTEDKSKPKLKVKMGRWGRLDCELEKRRFADEYQGPSDFARKAKTINFNFNDDMINGVFEIDPDYEPPDPQES